MVCAILQDYKLPCQVIITALCSFVHSHSNCIPWRHC